MSNTKNEMLSSLDDSININSTPNHKGWIPIDRTKLSYGGILYPSDWEFSVRPAETSEIRHYSSLDETSPISVSSAMYDILMSNVRIIDGNRIIKSDQIYEHDQLFFLLLVHEYTGNSKTITLEHKCQNCDHTNMIILRSYGLQYTKMDDKALSNVNPETGLIEFKTKSFDTITYKPITLRDSKKIVDYITECRRNNQKYEKTFADIYPLLRQNDAQTAKSLYDSYLSLNKEKLSLLLSMKRKMLDIRAENTISDECEKCDSGIQTTVQFEAGLANIFFDDNLDSELL